MFKNRVNGAGIILALDAEKARASPALDMYFLYTSLPF